MASKHPLDVGVDAEAFVPKISRTRPFGRIEDCQGGPAFPRAAND